MNLVFTQVDSRLLNCVLISFQVVPDTWTLIPWAHYMFLTLNVFMWISLYYANVRDPGFIPCNSPDYDMALKQVSTRHSICIVYAYSLVILVMI